MTNNEIKKTVLQDGSIIEFWTQYPPTVNETSLFWKITSGTKSYLNNIQESAGDKYIDDSDDDEEALEHVKILIGQGAFFGYDEKMKIHKAPKDAEQLIIKEEVDFLYNAYLARKNA